MYSCIRAVGTVCGVQIMFMALSPHYILFHTYVIFKLPAGNDRAVSCSVYGEGLSEQELYCDLELGIQSHQA